MTAQLVYAREGEPGAFSLARAFQAIAANSPEGRERNYTPPQDVSLELEAMRRYALQTGAQGASGGLAIPETILAEAVIPAMQAVSVTSRAGAREIVGMVGHPIIPVIESRPASSYVDQETLEQPSRVSAEFGARAPRPHMLAAFVPLTWSMARNTAGALEPVVRQALADSLAAQRDHAVFHGQGGTSPMGLAIMPGVREISFSGAAYTGAVTAANSAYFRAARMHWDAAIANSSNPNPRFAFIGEPTVGRKLAQGQTSAGKQSQPHAPYSGGGELMGWPAYWSNVAAVNPAAPQTGSDAQLFHGDWAQLTHIVFGQMSVRMATPTWANDRLSGGFYLLAHMPHDFYIGQPGAFSRAAAFAATLAT